MQEFVVGITGTSGSGKTTLITAMLPWFRERGLRVNVVKHSHHPLELEPPAKDSARFRAAGASEVMVASPYRFAIVHELRGDAEPTLAEQLARLAPAELTLVEGFRSDAIPRIEVYRPVHGREPYYPCDPSIVALATDRNTDAALPCLPLNHPPEVAQFILALRERHTGKRMLHPAAHRHGFRAPDAS
ncbi:molybdopterin-guanine dinucleotide biosynthesis protein B (plasmid) [Cupriavidus necator H16]|uniref:Molybdopterin-guanine dinucleotide biosynthesis protein B n=1 Tax=Cupriavidus necator (strain ATCC 17699 / DSM 428 / KCTC 22496 / NCIMB 10442 / H16 / Stanier 337) TaxID=381666 RepID=Q7WX67_CUPNH|nr:molybdopterin-guanine dinucleotide biosynthesis protein B [Cupriavidus necator]AAP86024.1 putative molybdopterin cofactor biosysnthesis protein [Cupriavidus necator H16]QCC05502.1 molybdopterin-guanine dinucleotide biosynthesis protein B [Cupriavidus necator H16]QQB81325.1 molybdopterin-guanine dinucleotide biosynthesis protein B [Cupriavidus necator]